MVPTPMLLTISLVLGYLLQLLMEVKCGPDFTFANVSSTTAQLKLLALSIHSPHESHLLLTECHCVHEPGCSVHDTTERTPAHVHVSDVTFGERQIQHLNLVYIHSLLLLLFVLCSSADYHCYCLHVLKLLSSSIHC